MKMRVPVAVASFIAITAATSANADMTGNVYQVQSSGNYSGDGAFGGATFAGGITDLWMEFDDASDILLNVYNFNDVNLGVHYYQSFTGGSWLPNNLGPPFETDNLQYADSYVSIGGYNGGVQPGADGTGLDPNFGGVNADGPEANGGWYNSNPGDPIGAVVATEHTSTGLGVFIGRFSLQGGDIDMEGGYGEATWNQGLGTPGNQAGFNVIPAPGAIALFALAGLAGRRRRR
jgi:hypothetical protein